MTGAGLAPILDWVLRERRWPQDPILTAMAARLPAVAAAGLEVPLRGSARSDLQQRIRGGAECRQLCAAIRAMAPVAPGSGWDRLRGYLETGLFEATAEEIWLEQDAGPEPGAPPLSVFLRLADSGPCGSVGDVILRTAQGFGAPLSVGRRAVLDRCIAACPAGAGLPYLGLMLGRPGAPMRLIVEGLPAADFGAYAAAVGLEEQADPIQRRAESLFAYADRIRLALTLGDRIDPEVGFECFIGTPDEFDLRWHGFFAARVQEGACSEEMRDRVLGWPAALLPMASAQPWPEALIAQALADGPETLHWLDCRLSHVKVSLSGGAKAYFGFVDVVRTIGAQPTPTATLAPAERTVALAEGDLVETTIDALLAQRTQAGLWLDYAGFREGISDEWVSAYIALALAGTGRRRGVDAARQVWGRLSNRLRAGWGWNAYQPADADSTIWGLRLAEALGEADCAAARRALAFLLRHVDPSGRVATYETGAHAAAFPDLTINPGWSAPHDCVTAAAAGLAMLGGRCLDSVLAAQKGDGAWSGYWWQGRAYPSALAAEALAASTHPGAAAAVARAADWAVRQIGPEADSFTIANALRIGAAARGLDPGNGIRRLAELRQSDGLWPGGARMLIPNAAGERVAAVDRAGVFTTATVLFALTAWARQGQLG